MAANLRLSDYEVSLINEISAISTFKPTTVRDVLENTFIRQLESILNGEDILIPFIGRLHVEYEGDDFVSGAKVAKISFSGEPSEVFKRLVGEIHDGESDIIWNLCEKKIRAAAQKKLEE